MGHDTSAYLGRCVPDSLEMVASPGDLSEEIAYLAGHWGLYEALDAQEYDGKVSGIGIGRWFSRKQLKLALRRLWLADRSVMYSRITWQSGGKWRRARQTYKPAIKFIQACLDRLPADHDAMYINFG